MMSELTLAELNDLVPRIQAGELPACDALLRSCGPRLHRLALWMLRKYPKVATYAEVEDLTQNASLRLLRALEQIRPESMKAFYALAALQIRRELLDLNRQLGGVRGRQALGMREYDVSDCRVYPEDERWTLFHEAVKTLPVDERETIRLRYYHGWSQAQVAILFDVSERTVERWWHSAFQKLQLQMNQEQQSD